MALISGQIVLMIPGPVISWLILLLSQKRNQLAILYELLDYQPQGYATLGVITCLFMKITIFALILKRMITRCLWWSVKHQISFDLHEDF
jgi:hypothetical protein